MTKCSVCPRASEFRGFLRVMLMGRWDFPRPSRVSRHPHVCPSGSFCQGLGERQPAGQGRDPFPANWAKRGPAAFHLQGFIPHADFSNACDADGPVWQAKKQSVRTITGLLQDLTFSNSKDRHASFPHNNKIDPYCIPGSSMWWALLTWVTESSQQPAGCVSVTAHCRGGNWGTHRLSMVLMAAELASGSARSWRNSHSSPGGFATLIQMTGNSFEPVSSVPGFSVISSQHVEDTITGRWPARTPVALFT